jgi:hypothetical protein
MKTTLKLIGIIAITVVIVFSMAGCATTKTQYPRELSQYITQISRNEYEIKVSQLGGLPETLNREEISLNEFNRLKQEAELAGVEISDWQRAIQFSYRGYYYAYWKNYGSYRLAEFDFSRLNFYLESDLQLFASMNGDPSYMIISTSRRQAYGAIDNTEGATVKSTTGQVLYKIYWK